MLLKDLDIAHLPTEVLVALKDAIKEELRSRRHAQYAERQLGKFYNRNFSRYPFDEAYKQIVEANSGLLLSLRSDELQCDHRYRAKYLSCILGQSWGFLFPTADTTTPQCYVYAHVDPRGKWTPLEEIQTALPGDPFYIGKGSGTRAWDLKRNQGHGKRIKLIRDAGFPDSSIVHIIAKNLTELDALVLEAKLIYFFGSIYDETINGCLLNLADHIKPSFVGVMRKLPKRGSFDSEKKKISLVTP